MSIAIFGLIGRSLKHTFSPGYFAEKFDLLELDDHRYTIFEFAEAEQIKSLKDRSDIKGLNVTIPYKEMVMQHLDHIDPDAASVGAVNTIKIVDGKWIGYNTDVLGFEDMLLDIQVGRTHIHKALILGSGGASKAVQFVCEKHGIDHTIISRSGQTNYENLSDELLSSSYLIVNTTPLGMYPHVNQKPNLNYRQISTEHSCIDLIYNPEKTLFLNECESHGATIKNGYQMLVSQAEHSWKIWNQD